jgi:DNA-binding response OmpR family regulator
MSEPARKPRILVVEDHPQLADIVETRLRLDGMDPIVCRNGAAAMALVEMAAGKDPFDAVILDVMMPGVDGFEVLRHIRATPGTADLPVILLTAKASLEDVAKGRAMGADEYVTKPFGAHDLVARVRHCLKKRREAQGEAAPR